MSTEELRKAVEDRSDFEACYLRANEVGILHRDDDGEYTSMFTKDAWALWQEQAQALRDQEAEIAGFRLEERRRIAEAVALASRAEKAEALLREIHDAGYYRDKITAHLGAEHD